MGLFRRGEKVYVCRKCEEEINKKAEKCPHCGYSPKDEKKSALYKATAFIPGIGVYTGAKSLAGDYKSTKSLAKKKRVKSTSDTASSTNEVADENSETVGHHSHDVDKKGIVRGDYVTTERIEKIRKHLHTGETVHFLTRGSKVELEASGVKSSKTGGIGYVRAAISDKRIAIVIPRLRENDVFSISYDDILQVDLKIAILSKRISLETANKTYHIIFDNPGKAEAKEIAQFIRDNMSKYPSSEDEINETVDSVSDGEQDTSEAPDPLEQLKNLKELHDDGVLTDEEFMDKKQDILGRI